MTPPVVVVGAGSAGAVVAARLSQQRPVLLLEAGPDHAAADTPAALHGPSFVHAIGEPGRVWPNLMAVRSSGQAPRHYLRGRGVGGSSAVNAMVALPGVPDDYDDWSIDGWRWADVQPEFDRLLVATRQPTRAELGPLSGAVLAAGGELAALTRDVAGRRVSTNDAYLEPARRHANLTVRGDAHVDRVVCDGRVARGVRLADGSDVAAAAVVVAAGAIHSPAILLRSGVQRRGIGRNLGDHAAFALPVAVHRPAPSGGLAVGVLWRGSRFVHHDLQVLPVEEVREAPGIGLLLAAAMRVYSRGTVRLASDDPLDDPLVAFNMLSDQRDEATLRAAIDEAHRLIAHPAVRRECEPLFVDTSDEGLRAGLADYVHAVGTCRMGRPDDDEAVVDPHGKVIGYEGLYVCDASVIPSPPRANTHLPTVMLAERMCSLWSAQGDKVGFPC
jgi:choline dehydrogenase/5-(hydroxymethyl)furfural/furfural oxidase